MAVPPMTPNATYDGSLTIAGIELHCYTLDDGRRILDMEGVNKLLEWLAGGNELSPDDAASLVAIKEGRSVMERV